jgi:hypothetical protein
MPESFLAPVDAEGKKRLKQAKVKLPARLPKSRRPTVTELLKAISGLPAEYVVAFHPAKPKVGK